MRTKFPGASFFFLVVVVCFFFPLNTKREKKPQKIDRLRFRGKDPPLLSSLFPFGALSLFSFFR